MMDFEITKHIATLAENNGWNTELNLVSWGDRKPKHDIRRWNDTHEKTTKGITLSNEEFENLKDILAVM